MTSASTTLTQVNGNDKIIPYNNWTPSKEHKLLEWQQLARLQSVGHGRTHEMYAKKNDRLMIPSIVAGTIAVLLDGVAVLWEDNTCGSGIPFIIAALLITAVATILDGILQATKPTDYASIHENTAKGYNRIILQIDSMLSKDYTERENGSKFLTRIEDELIALKTGGHKIPTPIWNSIKDSFLAKELDFQKIAHDPNTVFTTKATIKRQESGKTPNLQSFSNPVSSRLNPDDTVIELTRRNTDNVFHTSSPTPPSPTLPRSELILDDKATKKATEILLEFQTSRFG